MSPPRDDMQARGVAPWVAAQQNRPGGGYVRPGALPTTQEPPEDNGGNWGGQPASDSTAAPAAHGQGPSDWLSFNQYMGVAGPEMQQRIAASQAQANQYGNEAQDDLTQAGWQAQQAHSGSIANTASYGDFLKAKQAGQAAANSWRTNSTNPYVAAMEGMYAPQGNGPDFQGMYSAADNQAHRNQQQYQQGQQASAAAAQQKAAQQAAEQANQDQWFQTHYGMTQAQYQQGQQNAASANPYANTDSGSTYPGGQTYSQYNDNLSNGYKKPIY